MSKRRRIAIHPGHGGRTIGEYLAILWPDRPARGLRELFARGRVRVDGRPVSPHRLLEEVDRLELVGSLDDLPRIPLPPATLRNPPAILHEDARFTVLAKPSGLAVVPDRNSSGESCLGWLIRREVASRPGHSPAEFMRPRIVHRLDRLTSGLLIVARSPEAERAIGADLEARRVGKEYLAILAGVAPFARAHVDCPVIPGRRGKMRARWAEGAPGAETRFDVLAVSDRATLVRARPRTGRTHQIRVHAWALGLPLLVDPVYGSTPPEGLDPTRLSLHSHRYRLGAHWEEPREFHCPPPEDFRRIATTAGLTVREWRTLSPDDS